MPLDDTPLGLPLPHPDNNPKDVDVPRLRTALTMLDTLVSTLQADKADKTQVAADIAAAIAALKAGAPAAYDTLMEISSYLADNDDVVAGILTTLGLKANAADVTAALAAEVTARNAAIAAAVDAEATARAAAVTAEENARIAAVESVRLKNGSVLRCAQNPGAGWLTLDGSKYLRSAYPEVSPMFPGAPLTFSASTLTRPTATTSTQDAVVSANYIFVIGNDWGVYRAPKATVSGGADFTLQLAMAGAAGTANLVKTETGRIYAIAAANVSTVGKYYFTDNEGTSWQGPYSIDGTYNMGSGQVRAIFDEGNQRLICTDAGLFRVENNASPVTQVAQNFQHFVRIGGYLYGFYSNQIYRYDIAAKTGSNVYSTSTHLPGSTALTKWKGGLLFGYIDFNASTGVGELKLFHWALSGKLSPLPARTLYLSYANNAVYLRWLKTLTAADGSETVIADVNHSNGSGTYSHVAYVLAENFEAQALLAGSPSSTSNVISCAGDVLVKFVNNQIYKAVADTNMDTEFRLPNMPDHYIKVAA